MPLFNQLVEQGFCPAVCWKHMQLRHQLQYYAWTGNDLLFLGGSQVFTQICKENEAQPARFQSKQNLKESHTNHTA